MASIQITISKLGYAECFLWS